MSDSCPSPDVLINWNTLLDDPKKVLKKLLEYMPFIDAGNVGDISKLQKHPGNWLEAKKDVAVWLARKYNEKNNKKINFWPLVYAFYALYKFDTKDPAVMNSLEPECTADRHRSVEVEINAVRLLVKLKALFVFQHLDCSVQNFFSNKYFESNDITCTSLERLARSLFLFPPAKKLDGSSFGKFFKWDFAWDQVTVTEKQTKHKRSASPSSYSSSLQNDKKTKYETETEDSEEDPEESEEDSEESEEDSEESEEDPEESEEDSETDSKDGYTYSYKKLLPYDKLLQVPRDNQKQNYWDEDIREWCPEDRDGADNQKQNYWDEDVREWCPEDRDGAVLVRSHDINNIANAQCFSRSTMARNLRVTRIMVDVPKSFTCSDGKVYSIKEQPAGCAYLIGEGGFASVFSLEQHERVAKICKRNWWGNGMPIHKSASLFEVDNEFRLQSLCSKVKNWGGYVLQVIAKINVSNVKGLIMKQMYQSLHQQLRRSDEICWKSSDKIPLAASAAKAVAACASVGVIHGDIKPSNFMMNKAGNALFLTDFGLAREASSIANMLETSEHGTLDYRPPEALVYDIYNHANANTAEYSWFTPKADVWALGITILEIFGVHAPFGWSLKCDWQPYMFLRDMMKTLHWDMHKAADCNWIFVVNEPAMRQTLAEMISKAQTEFKHPLAEEKLAQLVDLLYQMLQPDPIKRITALDVLNHKFFGSKYGSIALRSSKITARAQSVGPDIIISSVGNTKTKYRMDRCIRSATQGILDGSVIRYCIWESPRSFNKYFVIKFHKSAETACREAAALKELIKLKSEAPRRREAAKRCKIFKPFRNAGFYDINLPFVLLIEQIEFSINSTQMHALVLDTCCHTLATFMEDKLTQEQNPHLKWNWKLTMSIMSQLLGHLEALKNHNILHGNITAYSVWITMVMDSEDSVPYKPRVVLGDWEQMTKKTPNFLCCKERVFVRYGDLYINEGYSEASNQRNYSDISREENSEEEEKTNLQRRIDYYPDLFGVVKVFLYMLGFKKTQTVNLNCIKRWSASELVPGEKFQPVFDFLKNTLHDKCSLENAIKDWEVVIQQKTDEAAN